LSFIGGLLALAVALGLEALLGTLAPAALGYVDLMMVPVAYYAIRRSQRAAMLVGCAGGLLHDAWFQAGVLGMSGFKKTLLAWVTGGLASRLDLNHPAGRFTTGALLTAADQLLEVGLYRLLDLRTAPAGAVPILIRAVATGVLVAVAFPIVDRVTGRSSHGRLRRRA
jgi:rod shape-determining protein MreD